MGKRSDVKERDVVSDPDIYNSLESEENLEWSCSFLWIREY